MSYSAAISACEKGLAVANGGFFFEVHVSGLREPRRHQVQRCHDRLRNAWAVAQTLSFSRSMSGAPVTLERKRDCRLGTIANFFFHRNK